MDTVDIRMRTGPGFTDNDSPSNSPFGLEMNLKKPAMRKSKPKNNPGKK